MTPVTDPGLLAQLNAGPPSGLKPVTDPAVLAQLNEGGGEKPSGIEHWSAGDAIAATPEAAAHLLSGAVAAPLAGLAGLVKGAINTGTEFVTGKPSETSAADVVEAIQHALTYEPRTQGGKDLTSAVEYLPGKLAEGADAAGEKVSDVTGSPALGAAVNTAIQAAPAAILHRVLSGRATPAPATAKASPEVQAAGSIGVKLTPEQAQSGPIGRIVQSLSGSAKLERSLSRGNANEVTQHALQQIGAADTSPAALDAARAPHNAVYDAVSNVGIIPTDATFAQDIANVANRTGQGSFNFRTAPDIQALKDNYGSIQAFDAADAVQEIRQLRRDARRNINAPYNPGQNALGTSQLQIADALENQLDRHIQSGAFTGPNGLVAPDLIDQWRNARRGLAQIQSVEDALDDAGNVSARSLHQQLDRGVPLSGDLETIARTYGRYPRSLQDVSALRDSGPFSVLDGTVGPVLGAAAHAAGAPVSAVSGPVLASILARPAARAALASDIYQRFGIQGRPLPRLPPDSAVPAELSMQDDQRQRLARALQLLTLQQGTIQ